MKNLPPYNRFVLIFFLFVLPLVARQQSIVPQWAKDAIWYQIFPERFANGDSTNDLPNAERWGSVPKRKNYFGGDINGIIAHLDYLHDLGVNALYLNPVFASSTNHKYHPRDYYKIDPEFGDEQTFKALIDECHRRGMHIIIDGVFNHTGVDFFAFVDIKKNESKSPYVKWYNVHSFPVGPPEKPNYDCWAGLGDLPKLMTDNPDVRQYLFEVTRYWMKLGIDGWRLDAAEQVSHDFWREWRKVVKGENPQALIVGEIWIDAKDWLQGNEFDAVMNYGFRNACVDFFVYENTTVAEFDAALAKPRKEYPNEANFIMQNLIGSHDTERYLTLCAGDVGKVKLTALMQMTYLGAPMIYYGDEIGMLGGKDPDNRRTMTWDQQKWNVELRSWYQKLIQIRKEHIALRRGSFETVLNDDEKKLYGFQRADGSDIVLVFLSNNPDAQNITLTKRFISGDVRMMWKDALSGQTFDSSSIEIAGRNGLILIPMMKPK